MTAEVTPRLIREIVKAVEDEVIGEQGERSRQEMREVRDLVRLTLGAFHRHARERGVWYVTE